jgi:hypothetical protein
MTTDHPVGGPAGPGTALEGAGDTAGWAAGAAGMAPVVKSKPQTSQKRSSAARGVLQLGQGSPGASGSGALTVGLGAGPAAAGAELAPPKANPQTSQ